MEILLIVILAGLLIGLLIALGTSGVPKRRRAGRDRHEEGAPGAGADPGRSRPAGPGAEGQHSTDAGTLHPPSQVPDGDGPDAVPPYRAGGAVDPGDSPERERD